MLQNDLITGFIMLFVALILLNLVFLVLTRVPDAPPDNTFILIKLIRPLAFLIAQFFILSMCAIPLLLVAQTPGNPIAARYPEITPEAVKAYMKAPAGPEAYVWVMLFVIGSPAAIWMMFTLSRRLHEKTWDEPGDFVSRMMRAWQIVLSYIGWIVVGLIILGIGLAFYGLFRAHVDAQIATLPRVWRLVQAGEYVIREDQDMLPIAGVLLGGVLIYAIYTLFDTIRRLGTLSWYATEGEIEKSRIRTIVRSSGKGSRTSYEFDTSYTYQVDGQAYQGERVMVGSQPGSYPQTWLLKQRFPIRARVPVYYHPRDPQRTVLVKGVNLLRLLTALLWIAALGWGGFLILVMSL